MLMMMFAAAALSQEPAPPSGAVLHEHARRGALVRLDGAAAISWRACASACGLNAACGAWTWRTAYDERAGRCDLHALAGPAAPTPGAVTGLSPDLAAHIEAAAERAPNARERAALQALEDDARPAPRRREPQLAGGR